MHAMLIFIALTLIKGGYSFPSVEKDPVSAKDTIGDETGKFVTRTKRNAAQFGAMIWCKVGRNPLDYNGYGCWCGLGGKGDPVDEIDRCCYVHDQCYSDITKNKICPFEEAKYTTVYFRKGCTGCAGKNSRCQKTLCECDGAAARCFKEYDSKFKNRHKNYDQSAC
ncbi:phospholipase A2 A2-actitoxin-Cgg2a-like isoform X2 [Oculina patagonica]